MADIYELIIVGAGPAGITSAVYAARKKMKILVLTKNVGGQTVRSSDIENYTGYQFISGVDLARKFELHMQEYKIPVQENETVEQLQKQKQLILVKTDKAAYQAKTVIVSSGKSSKELGVPGENEFKNKGLTYCATCDGPLFNGKDVAVIGGGNSALYAVLQMVNIATHVYLINVNPQLGGDAIIREKVEQEKKVTVYNNARTRSILGEQLVHAIKVELNGQEKTIAVQGVFVEIGLTPNAQFAPDVAKNERGEIQVNCYNETNIPGIFAAGDVSSVPQKQIIVAAGEGAKAALSAFKYLAHLQS